MKFFLVSIFALLSVFSVSSCKKSVTETPITYSIEGLWIGTCTADLLPNDPPRYFSFIIKPNNGLAVESQPLGNTSYFANGNWALNGNLLTCSFVFPTTAQGVTVAETTSAVYDKTTGKLTVGIFTNSNPPGGTGKFTMTRVN